MRLLKLLDRLTELILLREATARLEYASADGRILLHNIRKHLVRFVTFPFFE